MNEIEYAADQSQSGFQVFWLHLYDVNEDELWENAQWRAWDAIGGELGKDFYEDLKSGRRRQYNIALDQGMAMETMKAAFLSEQGQWLAAQDGEYDIEGFTWAPFGEAPFAKIMIRDDDAAMLFKLTFGGAA